MKCKFCKSFPLIFMQIDKGLGAAEHLVEEDFPRRRLSQKKRHRGSGRPLSPATPPDMRVRIGRFRGLRKTSEQPRKPERVEVGERKRDGQGRAVRHTPGTVWTTRRLCSEFHANPALA